jgi:hypothetical protein
MLAADPEELALHLAYGNGNFQKKALKGHDEYSSPKF